MRARKTTLVSLMVTMALALSLLIAAPAQAAGKPQFFFVPLSGSQEVPVRVTPARGFALFWLSNDQETLRYALFAFKIDNVIFSHIHAPAPAGMNAGVVAFLLHGDDAPGAGSGRFNGLLAHGSISADTPSDLLSIPFDTLVDHILAGNAYVNVHTNDGVGEINTGPGDFPMGELRGQIR
jgi:CHRD domain